MNVLINSMGFADRNDFFGGQYVYLLQQRSSQNQDFEDLIFVVLNIDGSLPCKVGWYGKKWTLQMS